MTELPGDERPFGGPSADELDALLAHPGRAPASLSGLAALVQAARVPAEPGPQPGEAAALAAYRDLVGGPTDRRVRRIGTRLAVIGAGGALLVSGGAAAAASGSLPDGAQQFAHHVFGAVGWHVPPGHAAPAPSVKPHYPAHPTPAQVPGPQHLVPAAPGAKASPEAGVPTATPAVPGQVQLPTPATTSGRGLSGHTASPTRSPHPSPAASVTPTSRPTHHAHPR